MDNLDRLCEKHKSEGWSYERKERLEVTRYLPTSLLSAAEPLTKRVKDMNKQQLVDLIAATNGISKAQASLAIDQVTDGISKALACGDSVALKGFGVFNHKHKEAGEGRNPRTGEAVAVKAKNGVSFTAGESLKRKMNP